MRTTENFFGPCNTTINYDSLYEDGVTKSEFLRRNGFGSSFDSRFCDSIICPDPEFACLSTFDLLEGMIKLGFIVPYEDRIAIRPFWVKILSINESSDSEQILQGIVELRMDMTIMHTKDQIPDDLKVCFRKSQIIDVARSLDPFEPKKRKLSDTALRKTAVSLGTLIAEQRNMVHQANALPEAYVTVSGEIGVVSAQLFGLRLTEDQETAIRRKIIDEIDQHGLFRDEEYKRDHYKKMIRDYFLDDGIHYRE